MTSFLVFSQMRINENIIQRASILLTDSFENRLHFGDIVPNDVIQISDTTFLIVGEYSIRFKHDSLVEDSYIRALRQSFHSSGIAILMNKNLEELWRVTIDDRRIKHAFKSLNGQIFLVGEKINMESIWFAELTKNGKLIDLKETKHHQFTTVDDAKMDDKGKIHVLASSNLKSAFQFTPKSHFKKRKLEILKTDRKKELISVIEFDPKSKKISKSRIFKCHECLTFGWQLEKYSNHITVVYSFDPINGYDGRKTYHSKTLGENRTINTESYPYCPYLFGDENIWTYRWPKSDVTTYLRDSTIDILNVPSEKKDIRIENRIDNDYEVILIATILKSHFDYMVIKLDKDYKFIYYSIIENTGCDYLINAVQLGDEIILIGKSFKELEDEKLSQYINIVKINGA